MSEEDVKYYQLEFFALKMVYQTRTGRADNEVLVFLLPGGPLRVTYISVDNQGVVLRAGNDFAIYADWHGGDRFVHMYQALGWGKLAQGTYDRVMRWDECAAWEVSA